MAVLPWPMVLSKSARRLTAVLSKPEFTPIVVLLKSACEPTAVLPWPLPVLLASAWNPSGRVVVGGGVGSEGGKTGGRVLDTGRIVKESASTSSRVIVGLVLEKRASTYSGVVVADGVAKKGKATKGRVLAASCKAKEGVSSLSRVIARIAAVRCRANCLRCGRKREEG